MVVFFVSSIFLFHPVDDFFDLDFFRFLAIRPIHRGYVGAKIQLQLRMVAQIHSCLQPMLAIDEQRVLGRGAAIDHDLRVASRNERFQSAPDLFQSHPCSTFSGFRKTSSFC